MNIPPQLYIVIQRGQTIETCPSCHRIIYWEDLMKDDKGGDASSSSPSAG
jgi:predicted  nucleic acid-binding Zn-ribbon protein